MNPLVVNSPERREAERLRAVRLMLLSRLLSYPNKDTARLLSELSVAADLDSAGAFSALAAVTSRLHDQGAVDAFGSEYIDLFDRGQAKASLHETEYGLPLGKGNKLADLAGFYQAFGFAFRSEEAEMLDHVAVELEFYALLLVKTAALRERGDDDGVDIVLDARRKFFDAHLGSLLATLAEQDSLKEHPTLGPVVRAARLFADEEAFALGIAPVVAPMSMGPAEDEQMECATSSRLPVVN
ncbi:MAG: molecular chaperone TorD family protein [Deltaproteobacteria bacterium]|nr:molecular chaperone TorD family protein [Deltaproteobacteria bacterium]